MEQAAFPVQAPAGPGAAEPHEMAPGRRGCAIAASAAMVRLRAAETPALAGRMDAHDKALNAVVFSTAPARGGSGAQASLAVRTEVRPGRPALRQLTRSAVADGISLEPSRCAAGGALSQPERSILHATISSDAQRRGRRDYPTSIGHAPKSQAHFANCEYPSSQETRGTRGLIG